MKSVEFSGGDVLEFLRSNQKTHVYEYLFLSDRLRYISSVLEKIEKPESE
jgi:hypothetical protein